MRRSEGLISGLASLVGSWPAQLADQAKIMRYLYGHERVPLVVKLIPPASLGLAVLAWKFKLGDFIPQDSALGRIDNLAISGGILGLGVGLMSEFSPADVVQDARRMVQAERKVREAQDDTADKAGPGPTTQKIGAYRVRR